MWAYRHILDHQPEHDAAVLPASADHPHQQARARPNLHPRNQLVRRNGFWSSWHYLLPALEDRSCCCLSATRLIWRCAPQQGAQRAVQSVTCVTCRVLMCLGLALILGFTLTQPSDAPVNTVQLGNAFGGACPIECGLHCRRCSLICSARYTLSHACYGNATGY